MSGEGSCCSWGITSLRKRSYENTHLRLRGEEEGGRHGGVIFRIHLSVLFLFHDHMLLMYLHNYHACHMSTVPSYRGHHISWTREIFISRMIDQVRFSSVYLQYFKMHPLPSGAQIIFTGNVIFEAGIYFCILFGYNSYVCGLLNVNIWVKMTN